MPPVNTEKSGQLLLVQMQPHRPGRNYVAHCSHRRVNRTIFMTLRVHVQVKEASFAIIGIAFTVQIRGFDAFPNAPFIVAYHSLRVFI
jgi:hypothetical protein